MNKGPVRSVMCAIAMLAALAIPVHAQDVAGFYHGKQITLVIGYGPGGGYDLYARMLGRFIGAHIPGNPTIVPQNMPGAGSRSAANWLYKVAPQDGTVIACLGQATPTDHPPPPSSTTTTGAEGWWGRGAAVIVAGGRLVGRAEKDAQLASLQHAGGHRRGQRHALGIRRQQLRTLFAIARGVHQRCSTQRRVGGALQA